MHVMPNIYVRTCNIGTCVRVCKCANVCMYACTYVRMYVRTWNQLKELAYAYTPTSLCPPTAVVPTGDRLEWRCHLDGFSLLQCIFPFQLPFCTRTTTIQKRKCPKLEVQPPLVMLEGDHQSITMDDHYHGYPMKQVLMQVRGSVFLHMTCVFTYVASSL